MDHGSRIKDHGSRIMDQVSMIKYQVSKIKYQVSSIKDPRSSIKYQVSSIKYQGSRIMEHGPCSGMNDHPGRDTDLRSRPSESTIKDLSFYIGFKRIGSLLKPFWLKSHTASPSRPTFLASARRGALVWAGSARCCGAALA